MAQGPVIGGSRAQWLTSKFRGMVAKMTANLQGEATQELLLGTWQAIGLIGDALVRSGAIDRAELLEPLAIAQALTHSVDRRHVAFGAVHGLIDSAGAGEEQPAAQPCSDHPMRPARRPRPTRERGAGRCWAHRCRPGIRHRLG